MRKALLLMGWFIMHASQPANANAPSTFEPDAPPAAALQWRAINRNVDDGFSLRILNQTAVPAAADWANATDHGQIIAPGSAGQWDVRMTGSISPCTAVKCQGVHYLYYVGADGNRADGGPSNRKIGVASSADGTTWTKHGSNPLSLTYNLPSATAEAGGHNAFAMLDPDSANILLYYGSVIETSPGTVDVDTYLAVIDGSDGFTVLSDTKIIDSTQAGLAGGLEMMCLGVVGSGSTWRMLYTSDQWEFCIIEGTAKDTFTGTSSVIATNPPRRMGGGALIDVSDLSDPNGDTVAILINDVNVTLAERQVWQGNAADLRTSFAPVGSTYTEAGGTNHMTVYRA